MNKIGILLILASLFETAPGSSSHLALQARLRERQANEQDRAGPYVITHEDAATGKKAAEIRSFIWKHWSEHRRGSLAVTSYSLEGVPAEMTFVLEPDERGVWNVKVRIERPTLKGTTAEHAGFRAYSVQRIEPRHDGQSLAKVIPEDQIRSGENYRLI